MEVLYMMQSKTATAELEFCMRTPDRPRTESSVWNVESLECGVWTHLGFDLYYIYVNNY